MIDLRAYAAALRGHPALARARAVALFDALVARDRRLAALSPDARAARDRRLTQRVVERAADPAGFSQRAVDRVRALLAALAGARTR